VGVLGGERAAGDGVGDHHAAFEGSGAPEHTRAAGTQSSRQAPLRAGLLGDPTRGHFASWNGTAQIEASSGEQNRHRLSRAGNRRITRVLHIMTRVLFEAVSAFATVGLSTGITPELPPAGQLLITALMFAGRVGPITVAAALAPHERTRAYVYPEERPIVG
jgi:Cation transport protein/Transposase IS116/IS110/IS902 family